MDTALLTAIAALLLCVCGIGAYVLKRIKHIGSDIERIYKDQEILRIEEKFDSPLSRLTFQQSFDPDLFAQASEGAALAGLSQQLTDYAADGLQVTLHGVRMTRQGAEMIVSASASGQVLFEKGLVKYPIHNATGMRLPQLVDARTGQIVEKLKEMPVSTLTSRLATISGAVVGAAHLVAGADLAKSLAQVDSKLDRLLALHRVGQLAKLERIYTSARELASGPMGKDRKLEMWRLRGELRELRSTWRQECSLKLNQIDDPANAVWVKRLLSRQRSIDRRLVDNISEGEVEIALIHYSMSLEYVLAIGSNTPDEFMNSQTSELEQLGDLRNLLEEKSGYISGNYSDLSVTPMISALTMLITTYRKFLPMENVPEAAPVRRIPRPTPMRPRRVKG